MLIGGWEHKGFGVEEPMTNRAVKNDVRGVSVMGCQTKIGARSGCSDMISARMIAELDHGAMRRDNDRRDTHCEVCMDESPASAMGHLEKTFMSRIENGIISDPEVDFAKESTREPKRLREVCS
jgi:hypothetical protein